MESLASFGAQGVSVVAPTVSSAVHGDADRVVQVLVNLLSNAIESVMDGSQTIAALRMQSETAAIPVIFLTAKTIVAEVQRMKEPGAVGILIKPFDPRTLAADVLALVT